MLPVGQFQVRTYLRTGDTEGKEVETFSLVADANRMHD